MMMHWEGCTRAVSLGHESANIIINPKDNCMKGQSSGFEFIRFSILPHWPWRPEDIIEESSSFVHHRWIDVFGLGCRAVSIIRRLSKLRGFRSPSDFGNKVSLSR